MSRRTIILLGCGVVAVVLGSLVLVFGRGGGAEATSPQVTVVVATEDLAPGTAADEAVTDGRLEVSEVDADDVGPGAIRSAAELSGRSIGVAIPGGAQLVDTDLVLVPLRGSTVAVPDGMQAVAIDVPFTAGGAGYISAGDRVDVLGLLDDAPGGRSTITVLRDVEVLDVSTEVAPRVASRNASQASTTTTVATATPASLTFLIAVPEGDVTRIVQAAGFHRLYLSLPGAQAADPGPVVSDVELVGRP